jgi:DNA-binding Xre family transcriptional regulator
MSYEVGKSYAISGLRLRISPKLWKLLIDRDMSKQQLKEQAGISSTSIAKLGKGENITTDVLLKICEALDCRIEDILETANETGKEGV